MPRFWLIFTAFHHLPPELARRFLATLADKADGLCIFEIMRRRWLDVLLSLLAFPINIIATFFAPRLDLRKMLLSSVLPVIPLMVSFDGVISALRTYTKDDIIDMLPPHSLNAFAVEYHEALWRFLPLKASLITLRRIRA